MTKERNVISACFLALVLSATQVGAAGRTATNSVESPSEQPSGAANSSDFVPEDQTPTGKFTTATEIKPIMSATKTSWVALREWDGQDLLYFTHLLAWRCGLHAIFYAVNDEAEQRWEMEPCYLDTATPNAIKAEEILPYSTMALGSAKTVQIRIVYDDGTEDGVQFERGEILMN